jgi:hypothetical protein
MSWVHPQDRMHLMKLEMTCIIQMCQKRTTNLHAHDQVQNALAIYDYESSFFSRTTHQRTTKQ